MSAIPAIANDITEAIGNTPMVRLRNMTAARGIKSQVLVKIEFMNPTGSVKDRMAVYVIRKAIKNGVLKPGGTIVEATSGNTGAAVAMFAAAHGYKAILTIPDKMSKEKVDTLRAFGAEVHVCPTAVPAESPESYYSTGLRRANETPNSFFIGQYDNLDNIEAHYMLTGPEIWAQTHGKIDCFVGGIGTGGTVSGTARFLKEKNPKIQIVAADPIGSIYYQYHKDKTLVEPGRYLVEGIGEDKMCEAMDFSVVDKIYQVDDKICFDIAREMTRTEGILVGGSAGGAVYAALEHAKTLPADAISVVILPDAGMKYISKVYNDDWLREKGLL
jgi:cystathionine beta-synthase